VLEGGGEAMKPPPADPTSPVQPVTGGKDAPPPSPPHELPQAEGIERRFEVAGRSWIARLQGKGTSGTGAYGLGLVEAVHFFDANDPERPVAEALLAHGRFADLFDVELAELLAHATPIVLPEEH
jgi:hypothetical protein